MTDRPPRDPHDDPAASVDDTAIYPAVEPEELEEAAERPPLDVDERDDPAHESTPDVIELPDHADDENLTPVGTVDAEPADPPIVEAVEDEQEADADRFDAWYGDSPESEPVNVDPDGQSGQTAPDDVRTMGDVSEPESTTSGSATTLIAASDESSRERADGEATAEDLADETSGAGNDDSRAPFQTDPSSTADGSASGRVSATASAAASRVSRLGSSFKGMGAIGDRLRSFFDPRLHVVTTGPHRAIAATGAVLILLSLLANSAGLALIVASAIVPLLIVITLAQHDVFEAESKMYIAAIGVAGGIVGLFAGWLASWNTASNWFDTGRLNYGAAGFGGPFAENAGNAPFWVWLVNGLLIPAVVIAALVAGPIAMRRWAQFRNEVTDGLILAGTASAGYAIATSLVLWSPIISNRGPQTSVGEWTVTVLGVAVVRPVLLVLAGAMLGAGVWKYLMRPNIVAIILPAIGGIGGFLLYSLGSVQTQSAGAWAEFLWITLLAVGAFVLYRIVLDDAIAIDREALGSDGARVVCPSCRDVTPLGAYCARCGASLQDAVPGSAT